VAEVIDFRCDDCGAEPGRPCVYMPPPGDFVLSFATKRAGGNGSWWKNIVVPYRRYEPFEETVKTYLRAFAYQMDDPGWAKECVFKEMSQRWRQAGKPIRSNNAHNARRRAVWDFYSKSEDAAMQDYLGAWLLENGSIFAAPSSVKPHPVIDLAPEAVR
jgi:hypothetical protein